ncbi:MAG TPA: hypothetical protein VF657_07525 [Actinoplanes sp.]|jgi:hypothetical protein
MASDGGWYLIGPPLAVALLALAAARLSWTGERDGPDMSCDGYADGLAIFGDRFGDGDDYGLLTPAALTDDGELAEAVRGLLAGNGIRSTYAVRPDGRFTVLVFPEHADEALRLVGGFPAL